ncbi:MAG: flippase-like domain-containing protein [Thermoanaerobaculales bacterium]|nr:flippase-like domain-containing protein [Thermoanaerobaculales bacterium]
MARRALRIVLSLALATGLMLLFLWNVDLKEMARTLARADVNWVVASILATLLSYWLRVVRWQQILRPAGHVRHSSAVLATAVGYAGIALLPARMGDILRPVLLSRRDKIPTSATLASILTERLFDLWTVVFFLLVFLAWPPPMAYLTADASRQLNLLRLSGWVVGAGLFAGTAFLFVLFRYQNRFVSLVTGPISRFRPAWKDPLNSFFDHFLDGLRVIQRPRDLVLTLGTSMVIWGVIFCQIHFSLMAFGIDLPFRAAFLLVALTIIGMLIPTPGGIGGFHAMIQLGLTAFFAIDPNTAAGLAIGHHAICFVPITVIGLICIPVFGLSLKTVGAKS